MSEIEMIPSRAEARRILELAAYGAPMPVPADMTELGAAKLILAHGTLKPLSGEEAVAIGVILSDYEQLMALQPLYEALIQAVRWVTEARERGNQVDFWRNIAIIEALAREGEDERDPRVTA